MDSTLIVAVAIAIAIAWLSHTFQTSESPAPSQRRLDWTAIVSAVEYEYVLRRSGHGF